MEYLYSLLTYKKDEDNEQLDYDDYVHININNTTKTNTNNIVEINIDNYIIINNHLSHNCEGVAKGNILDINRINIKPNELIKIKKKLNKIKTRLPRCVFLTCNELVKKKKHLVATRTIIKNYKYISRYDLNRIKNNLKKIKRICMYTLITSDELIKTKRNLKKQKTKQYKYITSDELIKTKRNLKKIKKTNTLGNIIKNNNIFLKRYYSIMSYNYIRIYYMSLVNNDTLQYNLLFNSNNSNWNSLNDINDFYDPDDSNNN